MENLKYCIFSFLQNNVSQSCVINFHSIVLWFFPNSYFYTTPIPNPDFNPVYHLLHSLLPHNLTWVSSRKPRFNGTNLKCISFNNLHILTFGKWHHYLPNQKFSARSHPWSISFSCSLYLNRNCVLWILCTLSLSNLNSTVPVTTASVQTCEIFLLLWQPFNCFLGLL